MAAPAPAPAPAQASAPAPAASAASAAPPLQPSPYVVRGGVPGKKRKKVVSGPERHQKKEFAWAKLILKKNQEKHAKKRRLQPIAVPARALGKIRTDLAKEKDKRSKNPWPR